MAIAISAIVTDAPSTSFILNVTVKFWPCGIVDGFTVTPSYTFVVP